MRPLVYHSLPAGIAFFATVGSYTVRELWVQAKMQADTKDDPTYFGMFAGSVLAVTLAFVFTSTVGARLPGSRSLPFAIGMAAMLLGFALRAWAIRTLGEFFRVEVTVADDQHVVDSGPYAWVRHPSYTGMMVHYAGLGIALDSWLSVAAMLLPLAAVVRRIGHEEKVLRRDLGTPYVEYSTRTRRLVPGVW